MKRRTAAFFLTLSLLAGACAAGGALAQAPASDYPKRPIRWIVPFPPAGSNDILARYLGVKLSERVGQQVVIDNRGGANGIIGTEIAASAAADGYTLLMVSTSFVMNAAVRSLTYDVEKSFDPVALIGSSPNSIVVHPKGPYRTLGELVEAARARPGAIQYASTGVGGFNHFGGELFNKVAGIRMQMVPYKGGGPAMVDVMAGHVPVMFSSITQVLPHVRTGRLKLLAVGSARRSPVVPDVPTVIESGYPGYEVTVWWGVVTPAGVPAAVRSKLAREFNAILGEPETQKWLAANAAAEAEVRTPAEIRRMFREELEKWTRVAREAGIRAH
jgi:tripartite-type tricarboxylate transporter receptor subunit TctC